MTAKVAESIPPQIEMALQELTQQLTTICQDNLVALILYGGLVRGSYSETRSDVNLMLVLEKADGAALQAIAAPLTAARRKSKVEPFILERAEIARVADVFPTKILDIQRSHKLLAGQDVFGPVAVAREHIRLSVEQSLRNLQLRLRRTLVAQAQDKLLLQQFLSNSARPLALELRQLLELKGLTCSFEASKDIFQAAAQALGLDGQVLSHLSHLRDWQTLDSDILKLAGQLLAVLGQAVEHVDALEGQV